MSKRHLVYVEHSVLVTERAAYIVFDEADLKLQIAQREAALRASVLVAKVDRDKQGKPVLHLLGVDWEIERPAVAHPA